MIEAPNRYCKNSESLDCYFLGKITGNAPICKYEQDMNKKQDGDMEREVVNFGWKTNDDQGSSIDHSSLLNDMP